MKPRRELSSQESVRVIEYMYGATCAWKHARRKDSLAFKLNARMISMLSGMLTRAYVEDGMSIADAYAAIRRLRDRGRLTYLSGVTLAEYLTPVDRSSVHIVVRNGANHFLMQHRTVDAPTSPGLWSIPGGGLRQRETPYQCGLRELEEETGLTAHQLAGGRLVDAGSFYEDMASGETVRRYIYHAQTQATDQDVILGEGQAMWFFPVDRIRDLDLTVVAKHALDGYLRRERRT